MGRNPQTLVEQIPLGEMAFSTNGDEVRNSPLLYSMSLARDDVEDI